MGDDSFTTGVDEVVGVWPSPPDLWSFSSLDEAEACPRRWALRRATYPKLWKKHGYPPRPSVAGLRGEIIHRALERILIALVDAGCASVKDPAAVTVLRDLGGYSGLVEGLLDEQLAALEANPRIQDALPTFRRRLRAEVPDMRMRVQEMISRAEFQATTEKTGVGSALAAERLPLVPGSYPEVELRSSDLGFAGRVDLLWLSDRACSIIDYKTGDPSPKHADQLRTYALLWHRDSDLNPDKTPVGSLTASYPHKDEPVAPPTTAELEVLAVRLVDRAEAATASLEERPPAARPGPDICRYCDVRQLCPEYWASQPPRPGAVPAGEFMDLEGAVLGRNGARSWRVREARSGDVVLLRTQQEADAYETAATVRFLNLVQIDDPDTPMPVVSVTASTEVFSSASP